MTDPKLNHSSPVTAVTAGDTVKLLSRNAARLAHNNHTKVDWVKRRGVVKRFGVRNTMVHVAWLGNNTIDILPIGAVEKA